MRRFLALAALSVLVSLSLTAAVFAISRNGRFRGTHEAPAPVEEVPA